MAEFKSIPIAKIFVPERLRAVEEDQALAISSSIVEHGLINPVTVRSTPRKSATPYTLVSGAHRLRAMELLDEIKIDCVVVEADADEARLVEITENLFRNDLSVMDRAVFVATYREVWEKKYGKIEAGRPSGNNRVNLIQLMGDEAANGFSAYIADRLGVSVAAYKRLNVISQNLLPTLRNALRGTPVADNQSQLLALAKMPTMRQQQIAALLADGHDLDEALTATDPHAAAEKKRSMADKRCDTIITNFGSLGGSHRVRVVSDMLKACPADFLPTVCGELPDDHQRALYESLKAKFWDDEWEGDE